MNLWTWEDPFKKFWPMICAVMPFVCFFMTAVFAEFSFTCVIDLVSALEYDGIISGFMQFYQKTVGPSFPQPICHIVRGNTVRAGRVQPRTVLFSVTQGEPYLGTAYAIMMCYWDGIVHFIMYLVMISRITDRWDTSAWSMLFSIGAELPQLIIESAAKHQTGS